MRIDKEDPSQNSKGTIEDAPGCCSHERLTINSLTHPISLFHTNSNNSRQLVSYSYMRIFCLSFALLMGVYSTALGFSGMFQTPQIPFPKDFDAAAKKKVMKAHNFMRKHVKLVRGYFHGGTFTSQSFLATSEDTSRMLQLIQDLDLWDLSIRFADFENENVTFTMVTQWPHKMNITVNSGKSDLLLKDFTEFLSIPNAKSSRIPSTAANALLEKLHP